MPPPLPPLLPLLLLLLLLLPPRTLAATDVKMACRKSLALQELRCTTNSSVQPRGPAGRSCPQGDRSRQSAGMLP